MTRGQKSGPGAAPAATGGPIEVTVPDPQGAKTASRGDGIARDIERGASRLLWSHGLASVAELPLPDGRRADLVAIAANGRIAIVEIKSCLADYRSDNKWRDYLAYCDAFYFAVDQNFPSLVLPGDTGLIVADRYGGAILRPAVDHPLAPARRKAMTLRFAKAAAGRLLALRDPDLIDSSDL